MFSIGNRLELKYSIFSLHYFCSIRVMLIKQLINLRKARTENLKFRTYVHEI